MEPRNLRELLIKMEAEMGSAYNKPASISQLIMVAAMVAKELQEPPHSIPQ